jgi:hypothetical protein
MMVLNPKVGDFAPPAPPEAGRPEVIGEVPANLVRDPVFRSPGPYRLMELASLLSVNRRAGFAAGRINNYRAFRLNFEPVTTG